MVVFFGKSQSPSSFVFQQLWIFFHETSLRQCFNCSKQKQNWNQNKMCVPQLVGERLCHRRVWSGERRTQMQALIYCECTLFRGGDKINKRRDSGNQDLENLNWENLRNLNHNWQGETQDDTQRNTDGPATRTTKGLNTRWRIRDGR